MSPMTLESVAAPSFKTSDYAGMIEEVRGDVAGLEQVVLIGRDFWERLIDFDVLVEHGVISPEDKNLFHYAETAEEAWEAIKAAYSGDNPALTARQLKGN